MTLPDGIPSAASPGGREGDEDRQGRGDGDGQDRMPEDAEKHQKAILRKTRARAA